jgi:hypothetical protein
VTSPSDRDHRPADGWPTATGIVGLTLCGALFVAPLLVLFGVFGPMVVRNYLDLLDCQWLGRLFDAQIQGCYL